MRMTVIGYHGTDRATAERLVAGESFENSRNQYDWLGDGVYFWENAPQRAWKWADEAQLRRRKSGGRPAVVGALLNLDHCFDLLEPAYADLLQGAARLLEARWLSEAANGGKPVPKTSSHACTSTVRSSMHCFKRKRVLSCLMVDGIQ